MEGTLSNHNLDIIRAEEALDFDFDENDGRSESQDIQLVPFVHHFQGPLYPKSLLQVEGTVLTYAQGFKIDFCSHRNDIIFHINPRLDQKYIARNSWTDGSWGQEEGTSVARSPIGRGCSFHFQIYILEKEFLVAVNGLHMFSYHHRSPFHEISRIEVFGDVNVGSVSKLHSSVYPVKSRYEKAENDLTLPLKRFMKHGLSNFGKIILEGRVKLLPVSFTINIQSTDQKFPHPKILYHVNARYSSDSYIVENSWGMKGDFWDGEVRSRLPSRLSPGSRFSLTISSTNACLRTEGADWRLPPFPHRFGPQSGGLYLLVEGDLILSSLRILPQDKDTTFVM